MNIFASTLIVMLSQDTVHVPDTTYHKSLQDCQESAQVIAREYYLNGSVKVFAQCKPYMET